jgi:hypothetical protein
LITAARLWISIRETKHAVEPLWPASTLHSISPSKSTALSTSELASSSTQQPAMGIALIPR